jgi:hypothetical protein
MVPFPVLLMLCPAGYNIVRNIMGQERLMYSIYMLVTTRAWPLVPNIRCVYAKAVDFPIGFAEIGGVIVDN